MGGSGFGASLDHMRHWTIRHSILDKIILDRDKLFTLKF